MTGVIQRERKRRRSQPISRRVLDTVAAKPDAWKLSLYEDEITPNFCLRELMKRDFRLQSSAVDPQALLDDEPARESYETAVQVAVRHESD